MEDMILYVVTGHSYYEDFYVLIGVFSSKAAAELVKVTEESKPFRSYDYFLIEETILNHPEKEII